MSAARRAVFVDGCRIPFTMANTTYKKLIAVDLARMSLKGIMDKTALDPKSVDYLFYGTVIQESKTSKFWMIWYQMSLYSRQ